ncbi:phosphopantetheine-binding protein [Maribacter stanieri]|uniref:phosphopantetheine-binding protein n=1 Tax=Maribacter stanieri TaxID=440514 RepID=UPI0024958F46|nr:phosphopantetheine-binding protein [Maribacter stanieri]
MGLDSIELVMTVEEKFGIQIPDAECEKIYTVQDFADAVYPKIITHPTEKCLSQIIFYKVREAIKSVNPSNDLITPDSKIKEVVGMDELRTKWGKIEKVIGLKLPELVTMDFNENLDTHLIIFGVKTIKRTQPVTKGNLGQLTNWIISLNTEQLIDIKKITSKYEVERIISGVINERIGIPINEIELKHSITKDLGVD